MPFNPVDDQHEEVREKIERREPGYAQSAVGEFLTSYERGFPGSITGGPLFATSITPILEEMIVDVARGEGIASPRTFDRIRIEWMIKDRRTYPNTISWAKKHKQADLMEKFYLNGEGRELLIE